MRPRRSFDLLGAWLLVAMGAVLLVTGAATLVRALVDGDWIAAVVTVALLAVVGFGVSRGVGQLRRDRSPAPDPDLDPDTDDR